VSLFGPEAALDIDDQGITAGAPPGDAFKPFCQVLPVHNGQYDGIKLFDLLSTFSERLKKK